MQHAKACHLCAGVMHQQKHIYIYTSIHTWYTLTPHETTPMILGWFQCMGLTLGQIASPMECQGLGVDQSQTNQKQP